MNTPGPQPVQTLSTHPQSENERICFSAKSQNNHLKRILLLDLLQRLDCLREQAPLLVILDVALFMSPYCRDSIS